MSDSEQAAPDAQDQSDAAAPGRLPMTQQTVTVTAPPALVNSESTGTHATSLFRRSTFISSMSSSASQNGSLVTGSTSSIPAHGSAVSGSSSAPPRNMSHFSASSSTHTGTPAAAVQRPPLLPQPPLSTSGCYTVVVHMAVEVEDLAVDVAVAVAID